MGSKIKNNAVIRNTTAFIRNNYERHDGVDILIEDGIIKKIDKSIKVDVAGKGIEEIDGKDFFVTPGFVNSHFHPSQQLNRALGVGLSHDQQMDLLHATDKIKEDDDKYWLSHIAVLEGLKAGTTCFYSVGSEVETQVKVYNEMAVRAACLLMPKDIEAKSKSVDVRAKVWDAKERIKTAENMHEKYHSELVRVHFGVVNVRYASDKLILGMLALAEKYDTGFQMHAAEGEKYVDYVKERTGDRPIEHLHKIGALNPRVSLAHMTQLTKKEIGYVAESGASVVHCPRANSYVAVGVCPVKELIDVGVNVALGSDAAINNNSNEVRGEARAAYDKMADRYEKADIIDYKALFRMLTINGAKAMGMEDKIGTIEVGKQADLVMWKKSGLPFIPGFNYIADLIFTDSCRAHTILIDGRKVLEKYKLVAMDEDKLIAKACAIKARYYALFEDKVVKHLP